MTIHGHEDDAGVPIDDDPAARVLWPGDAGDLTYGVREACVALLRRTHVWSGAGKKAAVLYETIVDHQDVVNARLNTFFLELHIDERNEIAYKLQADRTGTQSFPTLLHDASYNRGEVEVLLHLRREHLRAVNQGDESAYIDRAALLEALLMSRPDTIRDHKLADARDRAAVERLDKDGYLIADSSDDGRYRISPFIETLLTVERLSAFVDALHADSQAPADGGGRPRDGLGADGIPFEEDGDDAG